MERSSAMTTIVKEKPYLVKPPKRAQITGLSPVAKIAQQYSVFRKLRPLKVGIYEDLLLRGAPPKETKAALEAFTSTREYYLACRAGRPRFDIFGREHGFVTEENQAYADGQLALLDLIDAAAERGGKRKRE
jgi:sRNA-binding protein